MEDVSKENGIMLLYEVDPALNPTLPENNTKCDNFHNVGPDYTPLILDLA